MHRTSVSVYFDLNALNIFILKYSYDDIFLMVIKKMSVKSSMYFDARMCTGVISRSAWEISCFLAIKYTTLYQRLTQVRTPILRIECRVSIDSLTRTKCKTHIYLWIDEEPRLHTELQIARKVALMEKKAPFSIWHIYCNCLEAERGGHNRRRTPDVKKYIRESTHKSRQNNKSDWLLADWRRIC